MPFDRSKRARSWRQNAGTHCATCYPSEYDDGGPFAKIPLFRSSGLSFVRVWHFPLSMMAQSGRLNLHRTCQNLRARSMCCCVLLLLPVAVFNFMVYVAHYESSASLSLIFVPLPLLPFFSLRLSWLCGSSLPSSRGYQLRDKEEVSTFRPLLLQRTVGEVVPYGL